MDHSNIKTAKIIIRDARPEELDEVGQIIQKAYRQYEKNIPPPAWQYYIEDSMNVRSRLAQSTLIVAEVDGKLAGTVTLYPEASHSTVEGWPKGWAGIRLLGVAPPYRGFGIGRALMEECIRRCRKAGVKTIGLHTSEMMAVAKGLYERMGFKRVPKYDFHPTPQNTVMAYRLEL